MADDDPASRDLAAGLGRLLRIERERAGITQTALAYRVGLTQQRVSQVEGGRSAPTTATVERLFAALGWQLRFAVEPLDADLDQSIDKVAEDLGDRQGEQLLRFEYLFRKLGDLPYVLDGELAALLHGAPVPVGRFDMMVAEADLDGFALWLTRIGNVVRWHERWVDFGDFDIDPRKRDKPMRWRTGFGEVRASIVAELPTPVMVRIGDRDYPVRPMHEITDPAVTRVLRRIRARGE